MALCRYENQFEALYDATIAAVRRLGYANMEVLVTETGWPTQGFEPYATSQLSGFEADCVSLGWE